MRPTNALSAEQAIAQLGRPDGADLVDGTPRELVPSAEQLVSRAESPDSVTAQPQPTDDPSDTRRKAAALIDQLAPQTTAAELDLRAELPNGDDDGGHCSRRRARNSRFWRNISMAGGGVSSA